MLYCSISCSYFTLPCATFLSRFYNTLPVFNSIQQASTLHPTLHPTVQWQERLLDTHPDRHAELCQETSYKMHSSLHNLLCNWEIASHLLSYTDISSFSRAKLMNLSFGVSLYVLEVLASPGVWTRSQTNLAARTLIPACSPPRSRMLGAVVIFAIILSKFTCTSDCTSDIYVFFQGTTIMSSIFP